MTFNKIIYSNPFRNGDTHVSRSFIREIMKKFPDKKHTYFYTSHSSPEVLSDIKNLEIVSGNVDCARGVYIESNSLYISTWYASCNYKYFSTGCSITTLYNYLKNELRNVTGDEIIDKPIYEYLPIVDYDNIDQDIKRNIDNFCQNKNKIVLLCDNSPLSGQGYQVDFNSFIPIIQRNKDIYFVTTNNQVKMLANNLIDFSTFCSSPKFNLNEVSYISEKCKTMIGRCSGPHTFCWTRNNVMDTSKNFISFINLKEYDFGIKSMGIDTCSVYNFIPGGKEETIEEIIRK